ncbi:MAG: putative rane protein [Candidatus Saccharibacteria bacterium]|nr:putative rane protein [Candidatus Saccharibacteria bacterium]
MKGKHIRAILPWDDRIQGYVLTLLKLSTIVAAVVAVSFQQWGALVFCLLTFMLMYLPELIRASARITLPIEFNVVLVLFMYASVFIGELGHAYERFWWWDAALHTGSGFILGYIGFLILYVKVQQGSLRAGRLFVGASIFCLALAMGALWEIFEFAGDALWAGDLQHGSLHDTMWDLIVDAAGGLIMAVIGVRHIFGKKSGFITRWAKNFISINPRLGIRRDR